jgi:hypothetical protein
MIHRTRPKPIRTQVLGGYDFRQALGALRDVGNSAHQHVGMPLLLGNLFRSPTRMSQVPAQFLSLTITWYAGLNSPLSTLHVTLNVRNQRPTCPPGPTVPFRVGMTTSPSSTCPTPPAWQRDTHQKSALLLAWADHDLWVAASAWPGRRRRDPARAQRHQRSPAWTSP